MFVAMGIVADEKDRRVRLACFTEGSPIEISRAIGGEAESFATTENGQVHCVLLAFEVERKERFDPFG